jgi:hypothetical protein
MHLAVGSGRTCSVFRLTSEFSCEKLCAADVPIAVTCLTFMSPTLVFALDESLAGVILLTDGTITGNIESPLHGRFIPGAHSFDVLVDRKIFHLSLIGFRHKMEDWNERSDFGPALEFCTRAMRNDPMAIIGLPANRDMRSLEIEMALATTLSKETCRRLDLEDCDPVKVADWLIALSQELGLRSWIVTEGVQIFRSAGALTALCRRISAADPGAEIFAYNETFGSLLLESGLGAEISSFVMKLPKKLLPTEALLRYAHRANDLPFLAEVYHHRIGDVASALTILARGGYYEKVFATIVSNPDDMEPAIVWLFAESGGLFPFASKVLVELEEDQAIELFSTIHESVARLNRPFSFPEFVNILLRVFTAAGIRYDHPLFLNLDSEILKHRIPVQGAGLKCLIKRIFTYSDCTPDNREVLLLFVFTGTLRAGFRESLTQLCENFGFRAATREIHRHTKNFRVLIRDMIADRSSDVFGCIADLVRTNPECSAELRSAIRDNATLLVARDIVGFVRVLTSELRDAVILVIEGIGDFSFQNAVIHEVTKQRQFRDICLPPEVSMRYCFFLCKYFPSETRDYIKTRLDDDPRKFLRACSKHDVFDCLAMIYERLDDFSRVSEFFAKFIERELISYIEDLGPIDTKSMTDFVLSFCGMFLRKRITPEIADRFTLSAIQAFVLPLHGLSDRPQKFEFVTDLLRRLSLLVVKSLSYAKFLECIVVEFQELRFRFLKDLLLSMLCDYEFDLDQSLSMALIYHDDEVRAHCEFIQDVVRGSVYSSLCCCTCGHRLFGVPCMIKHFACGHVFHDTETCLGRAVCPVCNKIERLDQGAAAPVQAHTRSTRPLKRFEQLMTRKLDEADFPDEHISDIVIRPRSSFPN